MKKLHFQTAQIKKYLCRLVYIRKGKQEGFQKEAYYECNI